MVIKISRYSKNELSIPDSVMNMIIVLMTIIDNMILSFKNIFLKFDNIIQYFREDKDIKII